MDEGERIVLGLSTSLITPLPRRLVHQRLKYLLCCQPSLEHGLREKTTTLVTSGALREPTAHYSGTDMPSV